ncbi:DUF413 domain-containing protein [Glaciecola sp. 33A]|uniref:DUF413 domain-containing protein n=1 Tax=Glaciecola sp. 33A TaxID=2057807 RepID=UPI000C32FE99|nr:DUF413 domain-containing protein [Glaciecola sp. 33A]PKI00832.1 hypothetical protein CXF81_12905 [Glaciecola sp. 33A]
MLNMNSESLLKRMFSDAKHYPYGFSRSGDFSIAESKALLQYGCLIAALVDGHLLPSNDEEIGFIESAFGRKKPETAPERAWLKYQSRINRPKYASIHGTTKALNESRLDDDLVNDKDDDVSIDVDE